MIAVATHPPSPRLVARECGGWLALSPTGCDLRIGVEGDTAADAKANFSREWGAWMVLLEKAEERKADER